RSHSMTIGEAKTLGLQLLGAVGCGGGVSAGLIAIEAEDVPALWAAGFILAVGAFGLFAAHATRGEADDETAGRKPPP
ncbi:MAG: hypothetical protein ACJ78Y_17165, partial [Myxococcales bacterium]